MNDEGYSCPIVGNDGTTEGFLRAFDAWFGDGRRSGDLAIREDTPVLWLPKSIPLKGERKDGAQ